MRFDDYLHQHEKWNDNDAFAWFCYKGGIPNTKFKIENPKDKEAIENGEFIYNLVETRESLDITDMMPYFTKGLSAMQMKDLDGLNSPWSSTFVEYGVEVGGHAYQAVKDNWGLHARRIGIAVLCVNAEDFAKSLHVRRQMSLREIKDINITEEQVIQAWRNHGETGFTDDMIRSTAWHVAMFPFVLTDFGVLGPIGEFKMFLDADGKFIIMRPETIGSASVVELADGTITLNASKDKNSIALWPEWSYPTNYIRPQIEQMRDNSWMQSPRMVRERASAIGYVTPAFYAFHYLNYRNIEAGKVQGHYDSPREAKNRPPARSYHILKLRPVSARKSTSRPFSEVIGNMPLHTVSGCNHHYGPKYGKGLLFGKLEGRFWVAPHVRGNAKNGVVNKDYAMDDSFKKLTPVNAEG